MDFSFSTTAGTSQSTTKPPLTPNTIHTVKFDGCEIKDVKGVKDPDMVYKQLIIKFSNEDGGFEHTIWEPRPDDFKRRENEIVNKKSGKTEKIPQPSNVESMMLLIKHATDTLNPAIAKQIDSKEKKISAPDWDKFRELVVAILDKGKGVQTKIKLLKNKKTGEAVFPFFSGITKEGIAYVKNNFIGDKIAFSTYELDSINKEATAAPSRVETFVSAPAEESGDSGMDLNFDVNGI